MRSAKVLFKNDGEAQMNGALGKGMATLMFLVLLAGLGAVRAQNLGAQEFGNGETIVFLGNSITHGGRYHHYLRLFYATRFPDRKIRLINAGISGDVAGGMLERLSEDVLVHDPSHTFLMVGMNDVSRSLYREGRVGEDTLRLREVALETYKRRTDMLLNKLRESGTQTTVLTPTPYEESELLALKNQKGVNGALRRCAEHLKALLSSLGLGSSICMAKWIV